MARLTPEEINKIERERLAERRRLMCLAGLPEGKQFISADEANALVSKGLKIYGTKPT